jgi:hydroxyacylglutathione hydrolase
MIQIHSFVFNPFQENTYILFDETREAIIVDPGCYERDEQEEVSDFIKSNDLIVKNLINTHCHIDHVLGNNFVKDRYKVQLGIHQIELNLLKAVESYAFNYGFAGYRGTEPDYFLNEGDTVRFGNSELQVLFVPGHAPGHIALYSAKQGFCLAGDVLFNRSIGRTDLPGGNFETLIQSIHSKLFTLPDSTVIYPGHGPSTTIGEEKRYNPYCAVIR